MLNHAPFRRRPTGFCLILGPVLIVIGGELNPGVSTSPPYLGSLTESAGSVALSTLLSYLRMYLGFFVLAIGVAGVVRLVRGKAGPLAPLGGVLAVAGLIGMTLLSVTAAYDAAFANASSGGGYSGPPGYSAALLIATLAPYAIALGLILTTVTLWRAGFAPVWVPALVVGAFVVLFGYPTGAETGVLLSGVVVSELIAGLLLLTAFGFLGFQLLRGNGPMEQPASLEPGS